VCYGQLWLATRRERHHGILIRLRELGTDISRACARAASIFLDCFAPESSYSFNADFATASGTVWSSPPTEETLGFD
jgi:hypothetical protein